MAQSTGKKGFETEELLRAYFLRAGFFVVRGVNLKYGDSDLTDIDLWIYERSATLARRRMIIDIKDKQKPQASERLFFVSGLAKIVGVEGVGVATTDKNPMLRELAQKNKVIWIDGNDLQRLKKSDQLTSTGRLSDEQLFNKIDELDKSRGSRQYRLLTENVKSAVGDRFGTSSANKAIEAFQIFSDETIKSHPKSPSAEVLTRLSFFACALVAAGLDFASADSALRPTNERCALMAKAIRFGENAEGTFQKLEWTEMALRDYIENGSSIAKQIKDGFETDAKAIPAEDLADIVIKLSNTNKLFEIARTLESAAFNVDTVCFDNLPVDAKGFVGALLDFCSKDRIRFSDATPKTTPSKAHAGKVIPDEDKNVSEEGKGPKQKNLL